VPLGRGIFLSVTLGVMLFVAYSVFRCPLPITWSTAVFLGYLAFIAACARWPRWQVFVDLARPPRGSVLLVVDAGAKEPAVLPGFAVLVSSAEATCARIPSQSNVELGLRVGRQVPAFGRPGHKAMAQLGETFVKQVGQAPRFFRPAGAVGFSLRSASQQHVAAVVVPDCVAGNGQSARDLLDRLPNEGGVLEIPAGMMTADYVTELEAELTRRGLRPVGLDAC
jgi:hypothetical protein